jgi:hypothetical protein
MRIKIDTHQFSGLFHSWRVAGVVELDIESAYNKIEEGFEVGISDSFGGLLLTFGETVQK